MKTKDMLSNNHSSLHFYSQEHNEIFFQDKKYPWTFAISRKNMSNILLSCLLFKLSHHIIISKSMMMILLIDDNSNWRCVYIYLIFFFGWFRQNFLSLNLRLIGWKIIIDTIDINSRFSRIIRIKYHRSFLFTPLEKKTYFEWKKKKVFLTSIRCFQWIAAVREICWSFSNRSRCRLKIISIIRMKSPAQTPPATRRKTSVRRRKSHLSSIDCAESVFTMHIVKSQCRRWWWWIRTLIFTRISIITTIEG